MKIENQETGNESLDSGEARVVSSSGRAQDRSWTASLISFGLFLLTLVILGFFGV